MQTSKKVLTVLLLVSFLSIISIFQKQLDQALNELKPLYIKKMAALSDYL